MKIDPNFAVQLKAEHVLCSGLAVVLWDGQVVPEKLLDEDHGAFAGFCRSLDPNRCYIAACIPDDSDRPVFFRAREVARRRGLHMQASVDTPEHHRQQWQAYCDAKRRQAASVQVPKETE
jgi:hypothetical protein